MCSYIPTLGVKLGSKTNEVPVIASILQGASIKRRFARESRYVILDLNATL